MASRSSQRRVRRHEWHIAVPAGVTAVAAIAGALGLVTGSLDLGATINRRLPFDSPVFAGVGLSAAVGLPMMAASVRSWKGSRRAELMTTCAGVLLMGWIVVEIVMIRDFSPLQPILFFAGAIVAFGAFRRLSRSGADHGRAKSISDVDDWLGEYQEHLMAIALAAGVSPQLVRLVAVLILAGADRRPDRRSARRSPLTGRSAGLS